MKSISTKVSLAGMTSFLLVTASVIGFSFVTPMAVASLQIDNTTITAAEHNGSTITSSDNTSLNATTTNTVELAEEPFALGHYTVVSENMINETHMHHTFEGNTTITLPNSTESITTRDTGEGVFSTLPGGGGGSIQGQIRMTTEDGSESVQGEFTEFVKFDSSTVIGIAYFSTNSTDGMLAPLNNTISVFLAEQQPNGDSIARFFEWKSDGAPIGSSNNSTDTN